MGLEGMLDGALVVEDVFWFTYTHAHTHSHTDKGTNGKTLTSDHMVSYYFATLF